MASNARPQKKRKVEIGSEEEGKFSTHFVLYLHCDFWIKLAQNFIRFFEDPNFK